MGAKCARRCIVDFVVRVKELSRGFGRDIHFSLELLLLVRSFSLTCDMSGVTSHYIASVLHQCDPKQACRLNVVETIIVQLDTPSTIECTTTVLAVLWAPSDDFALRCRMLGP